LFDYNIAPGAKLETPMSGATRGRPPRTTHEDVERVALDLFARDGFERTTVQDIAAASGIGRRTLFRYFASKNDIVWGDFERVLDRLRRNLDARPDGEPVLRAVGRAVVAANHYDADQLRQLRIRMTLITSVPALQAHSMLRYAAWRGVVAEFAARGLGGRPDELAPQVIAHAALGAAMAAFARWVDDPAQDLQRNLAAAFAVL
jgi:TetR/AcrR family transcriptional regulator, regulator of mycofactocin system